MMKTWLNKGISVSNQMKYTLVIFFAIFFLGREAFESFLPFAGEDYELYSEFESQDTEEETENDTEEWDKFGFSFINPKFSSNPLIEVDRVPCLAPKTIEFYSEIPNPPPEV